VSHDLLDAGIMNRLRILAEVNYQHLYNIHGACQTAKYSKCKCKCTKDTKPRAASYGGSSLGSTHGNGHDG